MYSYLSKKCELDIKSDRKFEISAFEFISWFSWHIQIVKSYWRVLLCTVHCLKNIDKASVKLWYKNTNAFKEYINQILNTNRENKIA